MTQRFANGVAADVVLAAEFDLRRQQRADRRPAALDVLFERLHQFQIQRLACRVRLAAGRADRPPFFFVTLRMSLRFGAHLSPRLDDVSSHV